MLYIYMRMYVCVYINIYMYICCLCLYLSVLSLVLYIYICAYIDETAGQPFSEAVLLGDIPHPGICSHALSKIWLACMHACM